MKCALCKKEQSKTEFMPSSGAFWPEGVINICYTCIEKNVDGNDLNQVDRLMQHANMAFLPTEWRKIWKREDNNAFRKYANSYFDLNYYKYDWGPQNEKLMELARKGLIEAELEELKPAYIEELKMKWGEMPELDLLRLERFFNASLNDYNVTTEAQRDMLRKIARLSVIIDADLSAGKVNKDIIANYDKLMTSALKALEVAQNDGIVAVGQICSFIEKHGFQPQFYDGIPKDEFDRLEKNIQEHVTDLITNEVNLTDIFERRKAIMNGSKLEVRDDEDYDPDEEDEPIYLEDEYKDEFEEDED